MPYSSTCTEPFQGPLSATFFAFFAFFLVILVFKMVPRCTFDELSSVPTREKAVLAL